MFWTVQERIQSVSPKVVILSGGPNSVHVEGSPRVPDGFFEWAGAQGVAVLGICYGMQVGDERVLDPWEPDPKATHLPPLRR